MPLEYVIVQRGRVPLKLLLQKLAAHWGVQFVDLKATDVKPEALRRVREDYARLHVLIPFDLKADDLSVAMTDPRGSQVLVELAHVTGLRIVPYLAPPDSIRRAQLLYRGNLL
jgi:Type II secretion system (T2SS), protein E, N-terminal domain